MEIVPEENAGRDSRPLPEVAVEKLDRRVLDALRLATPDALDRALTAFGKEFGAARAELARLAWQEWSKRRPARVGRTMAAFVPFLIAQLPPDTQRHVARVLCEGVAFQAHLRTVRLRISSIAGLEEVIRELQEAVRRETNVGMASRAGFTDLTVLGQEMSGLRAERSAKALAYVLLLRSAQITAAQIGRRTRVVARFESPTLDLRVQIVHPKVTKMEDGHLEAEKSLLAKWRELDLEERFQSGDVSYPEYVLRNMDQFFTGEEQAELRKIAAMHGLELERLLMEIRIKSRTSEVDLEKLLATLKTLQERGIRAEVISRHETPSGQIEIRAHSRRKLGCGSTTVLGLLACLALVAVVIL